MNLNVTFSQETWTVTDHKGKVLGTVQNGMIYPEAELLASRVLFREVTGLLYGIIKGQN